MMLIFVFDKLENMVNEKKFWLQDLCFFPPCFQKLQSLTHSLVHHSETVPNSKKLQTTTELWLLKDYKIQAAWKKIELLILKNFTLSHNVFL